MGPGGKCPGVSLQPPWEAAQAPHGVWSTARPGPGKATRWGRGGGQGFSSSRSKRRRLDGGYMMAKTLV